MDSPFADLRIEYRRGRLLEQDLSANPMDTFNAWFAEACEAGLHEANGMTLATADAQGRPSARIVLLKGVDDQGFCFFSNYESRKAQELAVNSWAALVFWWGVLERQVRVEGTVARLTEAESDAYYNSRPRGARLGSWVSAQSRVIPNRQMLDERLRALKAKYDETEPPRPPFWGGYRLTPQAIEFWQGGPHRLHDRLRYRRGEHGWVVERLSP